MAISQNIEAGIVELFYIETSLPTGLTIAEYRRVRPQRRSAWKRFKELAGGSGATPAYPS